MSDKRIDVKYHHWFSSESDNGKAFAWLKAHLGSACDDAITNVIRFVYLPISLAESGASRQEVETEIKKAKEYLNEKMMVALGSCCDRESNVLAPSNDSFSVVPKTVHDFGVMLAGMEKSHTATGESTSLSTATEPDDGFLELDEDKLMEGY